MLWVVSPEPLIASVSFQLRDFAGAGYGWTFVFSYQDASMTEPQTVKVPPMAPIVQASERQVER